MSRRRRRFAVPGNFTTTAFTMIAVGAGLGKTLSPILSGVVADTVGISWVFAMGPSYFLAVGRRYWA